MSVDMFYPSPLSNALILLPFSMYCMIPIRKWMDLILSMLADR